MIPSNSATPRARIILKRFLSAPSLLFGVLIAIATLLIRHDDGSIVWESFARVLRDTTGLTRFLVVGLTAGLILARLAPRAVSAVLGAVLPVVLVAGIGANLHGFGKTNESEP